jgi:hypothetical protein
MKKLFVEFIEKTFCKHNYKVVSTEIPHNSYGERLQIRECIKCKKCKIEIV